MGGVGVDGVEIPDWAPGKGERAEKCEADWEPRAEVRPWCPDTLLGREGCGEAVPWGVPIGLERTPELGITRELREGVPDLDGPLKAEGMGLLLPLPPP